MVGTGRGEFVCRVTHEGKSLRVDVRVGLSEMGLLAQKFAAHSAHWLLS